jgi:hypothetical protein
MSILLNHVFHTGALGTHCKTKRDGPAMILEFITQGLFERDDKLVFTTTHRTNKHAWLEW